MIRPVHLRILGVAIALAGLSYLSLGSTPALARDLPVPGAVLGSAKQPPKIKGIRVRKAGAKAAKLRVKVRYPSDLSEGTTADVAVAVWRKPNHHHKLGTAHRAFPLPSGGSDSSASFTRTHRLRIAGRPGKRLNRALRRKGSAAELATVSVTEARLPGSDGSPRSVVSASKQVGGKGSGQRLRSGRQYGFSVYNASSKTVTLSALPVDCVLNDGQAASDVSAVTGTRLAPGQTLTTYLATNRGGERAKSTLLPMSRSHKLWFDLQTLQAAAANASLWGKGNGRSLTYGRQVSALPRHGGCKKAGNGDFALAAETSDGEHDEAYLTVRRRQRLTGSTLPGGHGVQISDARTDGTQAAVTVADDPSDPTKCTDQPSDRPWMWMTCMDQTGPPGWKDLPLNRMALVETHDAQTAGLSNQRLWVQEDLAKPSNSKCGAYDPAMIADRDATVGLATTQTKSLYDQLDAGARILDARFAYPGGDFSGVPTELRDWYGTHAAQVTMNMEDQLKQVVQWAQKHPTEQVIVRLSLCKSDSNLGPWAQEARTELGIDGNKPNSLCSVSGHYPGQPGDIRREDVQPGHNVSVYFSEVRADEALGPDSAFARDAAKNCGWHSDRDQFSAAYKEVAGPLVCKPAGPVHPGDRDVPENQEQLVRRANDAIGSMESEFQWNNMPFRYELPEFSPGSGGMQMLWTATGEDHTVWPVYRFVTHICPQTNIENNDLLRGGVGDVHYADSRGIRNRQDLYNEFSRYASNFMIDDIDNDFVKQVIDLNTQRAQDPNFVTYSGMRGWAVNAGGMWCMDLMNGSTNPGTPLQPNRCNGTSAESLTLNENGELHLLAADSLCLEARLGSGPDPSRRYVSLQRCNQNGEQRWTLDRQGRISGIGGDCIEPQWGAKSLPSFLRMTACGQANNQQWHLFGTLRSPEVNNNCLTAPAAGTAVTLQPCQGGDRQVFAHVSTSQLKIGGNCVQGGPPGAALTLAPCASPGTNAADAQTWATFDDGVWHLPNLNSNQGICLGTDDDGTHPEMRECGGAHVVGWELRGY